MPVTTKKAKEFHAALSELARGRVLCDILFGACPPDDYEKLLGSSMGKFVLFILAMGDGLGQPPPGRAIAAIKALPHCRHAAVFAVSPDRVAVVAEWGGRSRSRAGKEAVCAEVHDELGRICACGAIKAAEGRGAGDLRQCYQRCMRELAAGAVQEHMPHGENGISAGSARSGKPVKAVLAKAMDYIAENYRNPITLQEAAAHAFASPCYISRLFKRELGVSFVDYVGLLRIDHAKRLLKGPGMKVIEVAEAIGISDAHYFAKLFKKHTGITPSGFRAENKL